MPALFAATFGVGGFRGELGELTKGIPKEQAPYREVENDADSPGGNPSSIEMIEDTKTDSLPAFQSEKVEFDENQEKEEQRKNPTDTQLN